MKIDLLVDRLKNLKTTKLDDYVDRLHYLYSTLLIVFFVFVIGMQSTFKSPLTCKPDANFPGTWVDYTNNYCYTTGTYHTKDASDFEGKKEKIYINYYQWVPYALALQALSFYLPHAFYLILVAFTLPGLKLKSILERCCKAAEKAEKDLKTDVTEIANSIHAYVALPTNSRKPKSLGNSIAYAYILLKVLNLANLALNLYFLNQFIGLGDHYWAVNVVKEAYKGVYWEQTGVFPRISFCDVSFKALGQSRIHTIQCLLMINILIEKAYVIIYFWFVALFAITFVNLVWSAWNVLFKGHSPLNSLAKPFFKKDYEKYSAFCDGFMSSNGALLIRFVNEHAGSVTASKLVESLATAWKAKAYPQLEGIEHDDQFAPHLSNGILKKAPVISEE